ncbi:MAG TPA: ribokinase [Candidatus Acidoferrales bacterium]|nr:ribokinase [Candidatus Acidoferrales bacterium]
MPALVVVGSLNMDFVVSVEHLPAPGETVLGRDFQMIPGGKGANQACAAGKLSARGIGKERVAVRMIGRVGYDVFADHLKASLSSAGVDVSAVHAARSQPTGVALIWVDRAGQNSIVVASGANSALTASDVEAMRRVFGGASHALFQLESPLDTVAAALALAREEGLATILDPAPAPAQPLARGLLEQVDILTPNESEALLLLGRPAARVSVDGAPALAAALLQLGPRAVILKLGDQGCFYSDGRASCHQPAFPVEARDTTAAGDTFNAALAVALAEGKLIPAALRFANAAAAISVTRMGAQSSAPARAEVDGMLSLVPNHP